MAENQVDVSSGSPAELPLFHRDRLSPRSELRTFRGEIEALATQKGRPVFIGQLGDLAFDPGWFAIFDVNFRIRTLFTIPEVFSVGALCALVLDYEGIANVGAIAADESGVEPSSLAPRPLMVHSRLLSRAFECLRTEGYGLPPLDERPLFLQVRLFLAVEAMLSEHSWSSSLAVEMRAEIRSVYREQTPVDFLGSGNDVWHLLARDEITAWKDARQLLASELRKAKLCEALLTYCRGQNTMLRSVNPARVIGRALMHEYLADDMLQTIEAQLMHAHRLRSQAFRQRYDTEVAPYFLAHCDAGREKFVEQEHRERMLALAGRIATTPAARAVVCAEAARFAAEQSALWEALNPRTQAMASG